MSPHRENELEYDDADLSSLDRPEIRRIAFYPRKSSIRPPQPHARDYLVEVEPGVRIGCRFYTRTPESPSMLCFHGNDEIVDDYDRIAPLFNQIGINFFVASYRGFGFSDDTPTVIDMFKDSHGIFKEFRKVAGEYGSRKGPFIMGRSLGGLSAVDLAYHHDIRGLIIECGSANTFRQFIRPLVSSNHPIWNDDWKFHSKVRLRSVFKPTLIIHGERDSLIPVEEARELYDNSGAKDKRLEIIPHGDHDNLMTVGREQYFNAIERFVRTYS